jgi:hypothetical protein
MKKMARKEAKHKEEWRAEVTSLMEGTRGRNQFDILITLFQINTLWSHALANCDSSIRAERRAES